MASDILITHPNGTQHLYRCVCAVYDATSLVLWDDEAHSTWKAIFPRPLTVSVEAVSHYRTLPAPIAQQAQSLDCITGEVRALSRLFNPISAAFVRAKKAHKLPPECDEERH